MSSKTVEPSASLDPKLERQVRVGVKKIIESAYGQIRGLPTFAEQSDGAIHGLFRGEDVYSYELTRSNKLSYLEASVAKTHSDSFLIGLSIDSGLSLKHIDNKPKNCVIGTQCGDSCVKKGHRCQIDLPPVAARTANQVRSLLHQQRMSEGEAVAAAQKFYDTERKAGRIKPGLLEKAGVIKPKAPASKPASGTNSPAPSLPFGPEALAIAAVPALALAAGGAYVADDPKGSGVALTRIYQDALEASGARVYYPKLVTFMEKFSSKAGGDVDKDATEALAGAVTLAHAEVQAKKDRGPGFVGAKERLEYIQHLVKDKTRAQDFKFALSLFKDNKRVPPYPEELAALRYYTDTVGYKEMNMTLRGQDVGLNDWLRKNQKDQRSPKQVKEDALRDIKMVNSALNSIPNFKGTAYRGMSLPQSVIDGVKVGGTWEEHGFTSTTLNPLVSYPGNVVMTIKSKTGKDIRKFEKYANEEVLFRAGTNFEITGKRKVKKFGKEFWLIEMNEGAGTPAS